MMRAVASVPPPGGYGDMSRSGFDGYDCAAIVFEKPMQHAMSAHANDLENGIFPPWIGRSKFRCCDWVVRVADFSLRDGAPAERSRHEKQAATIFRHTSARCSASRAIRARTGASGERAGRARCRRT